MKPSKLFFPILFFLTISLQAYSQKLLPEQVAQGQLDAYNQQDIDGFLSWYAEEVEVYNFPGELVYKGKDQMRKIYTQAWARNPKQKAAVTSRMSVGNTVMDKEHVTGRANGVAAQVIAIYKIENDKIRQVYFVRE
jgi:hypothetical protein